LAVTIDSSHPKTPDESRISAAKKGDVFAMYEGYFGAVDNGRGVRW
jgi:hypothetical protein